MVTHKVKVIKVTLPFGNEFPLLCTKKWALSVRPPKVLPTPHIPKLENMGIGSWRQSEKHLLLMEFKDTRKSFAVLWS